MMHIATSFIFFPSNARTYFLPSFQRSYIFRAKKDYQRVTNTTF